MWCAVTATVHFSAAVVFVQSAAVSDSRRAVAASTLASNSLASESPLAPIVLHPPWRALSSHRRTGPLRDRQARRGDWVGRRWVMATCYRLVTPGALEDLVHVAARRWKPAMRWRTRQTAIRCLRGGDPEYGSLCGSRSSRTSTSA